MILTLNKYISSICPVCNEPNIVEITPFGLKSGYEVSCSVCKSSYLKIHKHSPKKYVFEISCFICDDTHRFDISSKGMWGSRLTALACPAGGIDTIYIGEEGAVTSAAEHLIDKLKSMSQTTPEEIYSNADPVIHHAIEELNLKLGRNRVFCMCGNCSLIVRVSPHGITLTCGNCNASDFIPMKTEDDLYNFKKRETVLLL